MSLYLIAPRCSYTCPLNMSASLDCAPLGGFALVFQQESLTALGEYRNNFGAGLGFQGLSGVMALAFDMAAVTHSGLPRQ